MNDYKSKYNFALERIKTKDELIKSLKNQLELVKNNVALGGVIKCYDCKGRQVYRDTDNSIIVCHCFDED